MVHKKIVAVLYHLHIPLLFIQNIYIPTYIKMHIYVHLLIFVTGNSDSGERKAGNNRE